jgi:ectoine hydroxylase-related dioxygenase (phytanoyl-CoA dioxygenase family)
MNQATAIDQLRHQFETQGYVVCPDVLTPDEMLQINQELNRHYNLDDTSRQSENTSSSFDCQVISWNPLSDNNAVFKGLLGHPQLRQVTTACIGENYHEGDSLVMLSRFGGVGQAWHQDCPPDNLEHFNVNRLFYTRDIKEEDGAIVVVPGSHRHGRIPTGGSQDPMPGEIHLTPKAGTLVLLNGLCYHRVTPNISKTPRISINFRAFAQGVPTNLCNIGVYRNGAMDFVAGKAVDR